MKSLKLASIAALFLLVIASCSKESSSLSSTDSSARNTILSANRSGQTQLQGQEKKPVLTPKTEKDGNSVTVSYKATNILGADITCGYVVIYQKQDDGSWKEVARGLAPEASFTFAATKTGACAYTFRAGFDPGTGNNPTNCKGAYSGFDYLEEGTDYCVDIDACVEDFTVTDDVELIDRVGDVYTFKVTYTLTSPDAYDYIKFQGGATSGGHFEHGLISWSDNLEIVNENKQNNVLKYERGIEACTPVKVWFTYKRRFTCPEVPGTETPVTGDWTVKDAAGVELAEPITATYTCQN